jgi:hypothetical protein
MKLENGRLGKNTAKYFYRDIPSGDQPTNVVNQSNIFNEGHASGPFQGSNQSRLNSVGICSCVGGDIHTDTSDDGLI